MTGSRQASSAYPSPSAREPLIEARGRREGARRLRVQQGATTTLDAVPDPHCRKAGLARGDALSGTCRLAPSRSPTAVSTSVSGPPAAARLPSRSKASDRRSCKPRPTAIFQRAASRPKPACAIVSALTAVKRHCPTRRQDFNLKEPHGPSEIVDPGFCVDRPAHGAGSHANISSSTRCISALSPPMAAGRPPRGNCRLWPSSASPS